MAIVVTCGVTGVRGRPAMASLTACAGGKGSKGADRTSPRVAYSKKRGKGSKSTGMEGKGPGNFIGFINNPLQFLAHVKGAVPCYLYPHAYCVILTVDTDGTVFCLSTKPKASQIANEISPSLTWAAGPKGRSHAMQQGSSLTLPKRVLPTSTLRYFDIATW